LVFPSHALLIVEERLREQEAEGVEMPEGIERESWRFGFSLLPTSVLEGP
jgi:hypothetical protein